MSATKVSLPPKPSIAPLDYPKFTKQTVEVHKQLTNKYFANFEQTNDDFHLGGAVLHSMWWEGITSKSSEDRVVHKSTVLKYWGLSEDSLPGTLLTAAKSLQGSGWVYLTSNGQAKIINNHDLPKRLEEITLLIDLWEHSMVDFQYDKQNYIDAVLEMVNWTVINRRIEKGMK
jgi:superoxide dismutase